MITRTLHEPEEGVGELESKPWDEFEEGELFRPRCWKRTVFVKVGDGALHLRDNAGTKQFNWWDGDFFAGFTSRRFDTCVPVTNYAENIEIRSDE